MAVPESATGNETLREVTLAYEDDGFTGQFGAADDADVTCFSCHQRSPASAIQLEAMTRIEGASDPDDMAAIAAVVCPRCHAKGTLTLMFGPNATMEESEVLRFLEDQRNSESGGITPS
jgi:hypothetical protein